MAKAAYGILLMAVWVTVAATAALKDDTMLPGKKFFHELPEYEQPDFLTFELSRGYTAQISNNQSTQIYDEKIVFPDALNISKDRVEKFQTIKPRYHHELISPEFTIGTQADLIFKRITRDIFHDKKHSALALEAPRNFTQNLYNFVRTEFNLDESGICTLILRHIICLENGECFDLNDLGVLCCPF